MVRPTPITKQNNACVSSAPETTSHFLDYPMRPLRVFGGNHQDIKAILLSFPPHSLRVIYVQVYSKSTRVLAGRLAVGKTTQVGCIGFLCHHSVNPHAIQGQ